ncbi:NADH-quinone oxidoreductase subunit J [Desulfonatronum thiosulfatophilum]|uniref:NADH-quinone oxidoreductase subunit J n=1 Tax=Desulfonatronum thiosulfatophilum TaxID=617002 RepID=A0A1G6CYJ4_9BACT|nr:NADH-quinone oxidoreductase subunit J [Desulfonatronum thiosulfatophilum]SDB37972.1 NADH-quinone oxidoreductase subunit J [Desulfonatronum thiosulfatophilum]
MPSQNLAYAVMFGHIVFIVVGALMTVLSQNLVRALLGLIMTLFGVAGLFFLMSAPFVGLMQILIYIGAVSILIFFAIMLTQSWSTGDEFRGGSRKRLVPATLTALAPALFLGLMIIYKAPASMLVAEETEVKALGRFLLEPYILPFELISLLLTVAMAGAVILGFERRKQR